MSSELWHGVESPCAYRTALALPMHCSLLLGCCSVAACSHTSTAASTEEVGNGTCRSSLMSDSAVGSLDGRTAMATAGDIELCCASKAMHHRVSFTTACSIAGHTSMARKAVSHPLGRWRACSPAASPPPPAAAASAPQSLHVHSPVSSRCCSVCKTSLLSTASPVTHIPSATTVHVSASGW